MTYLQKADYSIRETLVSLLHHTLNNCRTLYQDTSMLILCCAGAESCYTCWEVCFGLHLVCRHHPQPHQICRLVYILVNSQDIKYLVSISFWYSISMVSISNTTGDYVSEEVWYRVVQIVINRQEVQGYAAKTCFEVNNFNSSHTVSLTLWNLFLTHLHCRLFRLQHVMRTW